MKAYSRLVTVNENLMIDFSNVVIGMTDVPDQLKCILISNFEHSYIMEMHVKGDRTLATIFYNVGDPLILSEKVAESEFIMDNQNIRTRILRWAQTSVRIHLYGWGDEGSDS